jgi:predicted DNA-binding transcriptional regulator AlpA
MKEVRNEGLMPSPPSAGRYLRADELAVYLSIGRSTVWLWCKTKPRFPSPIRLSPRVTVFDLREVERFLSGEAAQTTVDHDQFQ